MNYSEMLDFEINKAVAFHIGLSTVIAAENLEFNPCNSWADAGPIIDQYGIGLMPLKRDLPKAWDISAGLLSNTDYKHENILRAAMIVFLMMQEQPNA